MACCRSNEWRTAPEATWFCQSVIFIELTAGMGLDPKVYVISQAGISNIGGTATLIGASANIVSVGMAKRFNQNISFLAFMKSSAAISLVTLLIASGYLIVFLWLSLQLRISLWMKKMMISKKTKNEAIRILMAKHDLLKSKVGKIIEHGVGLIKESDAIIVIRPALM
jgi:di/tricarboxylate transporter